MTVRLPARSQGANLTTRRSNLIPSLIFNKGIKTSCLCTSHSPYYCRVHLPGPYNWWLNGETELAQRLRNFLVLTNTLPCQAPNISSYCEPLLLKCPHADSSRQPRICRKQHSGSQWRHDLARSAARSLPRQPRVSPASPHLIPHRQNLRKRNR